MLRFAEAEVSDWLTWSKRAGIGECQHGACSEARESFSVHQAVNDTSQ